MSSENGAIQTAEYAVDAEGIGKVYELGETASLTRTLRALRPRQAKAWREEHSLTALHDVSFTIGWGETFSFIGANGSGKSTLASILSGLVQPTVGRVVVPARTIPVIGLGAGVHPEMTGFENLQQYSIALGYSPEEIEAVIEPIVDFAKLSKAHMNTPLKRYSSGMKARLSISTVMHLPAELYILDEVLAKADTAFKTQCLEHISKLVSGGASVVYIGHEMELIRNLCTRGIWLEEGALKLTGPIEDVLMAYARSALGREEIERRAAKTRRHADEYERLAAEAGAGSVD